MKIYNQIDEIPYSKMRAIAIGAFDGVHLGHRKIIETLVASENESQKQKLSAMIITFEPIPRAVFNPNFKILTTIDERLNCFETLNVNEVLVVPFNKEFANITAEDFVRNYLYQKIGFTKLYIGFNHSFGKNREGNYDFVKKINLPETKIIPCEPIVFQDTYISSTKIRNYLINGEIENANMFLGRKYSIAGKVVKGKQIGQKIGFPTANIIVNNQSKLVPKNGVYSCEVIIDESKRTSLKGMTNIGYRPTFYDNSEKNIEVHIFDFDEDIYGKQIEILFQRFIREEKKFDTSDDLIEQLFNDKKNCLSR
ncbi:MAG: bifunctional riboflavin kinase/FAD synthetase [Ignavibacteria bacterium]|jgi:riboflavin kinase/FMN adenylyltransferase|nr:bifunctional riboflavin kinase/FAD synthetase [Ignavibacteria bacterium]